MNKKGIKLSEKNKYSKVEIKELKNIEAAANKYRSTLYKKGSLDKLIESAKISDPSTAKKWEESAMDLEYVEKSLKRIKKRCGIKSFDELVAKS